MDTQDSQGTRRRMDSEGSPTRRRESLGSPRRESRSRQESPPRREMLQRRSDERQPRDLDRPAEVRRRSSPPIPKRKDSESSSSESESDSSESSSPEQRRVKDVAPDKGKPERRRPVESPEPVKSVNPLPQARRDRPPGRRGRKILKTPSLSQAHPHHPLKRNRCPSPETEKIVL